MRLVTFASTSESRLGLVQEDKVYDLTHLLGDMSCMKQLIGGWPSLSAKIQGAQPGSPELPFVGTLDKVSLQAPVPRPEKVICIGLNYADHAAETGASIPTEPVVFNKFPETVIGPEAEIHLPAISREVDFEAELVVVIGQAAKNLSEEEAEKVVFGYTCGHDVSARDWQKGRPGGQWLLGKTFDTFGPMGPVLVTKDEIADAHQLGIRFRLNGELLQDSSTSQLIFKIPKLIAHLSAFTTLKPGDVIFTGTPPGVGVARDPQVFLKPGDVAEVEIENLGSLVNRVVGPEGA